MTILFIPMSWKRKEIQCTCNIFYIGSVRIYDLKKRDGFFFLSLTNAQSLVQTCGGPVGILSPSLCQCLLFLWIPSETRALLHYKMRHSLYTMPLRNGTVDPNVLNPVFLVYSSAFSTFRSRYLIVWICEIVLYTKKSV